MQEEEKRDSASTYMPRHETYWNRIKSGRFLTKSLTVDEKQFKSLQAWGKRHGVVVEKYQNKGGAGRPRKKEVE